LIARQVHLHVEEIDDELFLGAFRFQSVLAAEDERCDFPVALEVVEVFVEALGVAFLGGGGGEREHSGDDCGQEDPHDVLSTKREVQAPTPTPKSTCTLMLLLAQHEVQREAATNVRAGSTQVSKKLYIDAADLFQGVGQHSEARLLEAPPR